MRTPFGPGRVAASACPLAFRRDFRRQQRDEYDDHSENGKNRLRAETPRRRLRRHAADSDASRALGGRASRP